MINATTVGQMMNTIGFGLGLSALALGSFVEQINYNDNSIMMDNQSSGNTNSQSPMFGDDWNNYFKEKYGAGNVQWKPTSFQDIIDNPQRLWGCTPSEIQAILGDGWSFKTYGSNGQGWEFYSSKGSIFYHTGGGLHGDGTYYGFSTGPTGRVKIVDDQYIPTLNDKATIIPRDK